MKNCLVIFDTSGSKSWQLIRALKFPPRKKRTAGKNWKHGGSCSVMNPFLSTSSSAKSAATWPGTHVDSGEAHRNFKAFPAHAQRMSQGRRPVTPMDLARFTNSPFGTRPTWQTAGSFRWSSRWVPRASQLSRFEMGTH